MKSKIILFISFILMLFSCRTNKRFSFYDYLVVYDNFDGCTLNVLDDGTPQIYTQWKYPNVLILKKDYRGGNNNSYENYFMGNISISGVWKVEGDTLYLFPRYEFRFDSIHQAKDMYPIDKTHMDESRINQKWLIKEDYIYERTDLSVYFDEYDEKGNLIKKGVAKVDNPNNSLRLRSKTKLKE